MSIRLHCLEVYERRYNFDLGCTEVAAVSFIAFDFWNAGKLKATANSVRSVLMLSSVMFK